MTLKTHAVVSALLSKGFSLDDTHHHMYWFWLDGKKTRIRTRVSHNSREIDDHLIGQMSKQTQLRKTDFVRLIQCSLSAEQYSELIRQIPNA